MGSTAPVPPRSLTVVAPVFNEASGIAHFVAGVVDVMNGLPYAYTVVLVNDGSTDGSAEELDRLQALHPEHVVVIHLSRNFGHQAALTAGMDYADGDAMICLDSDLQHPPTLIPELVAHWERGFDVVQAARRSIDDASWFKVNAARGFYALLNLASPTRIEPMASDFRLLSRPVLEVFRRDLRERDRFIRGLVSWVGFRSTCITFDAPARAHGRSSYSLTRMLRFARTGMISFSKLPLKVASLLGLIISGFSVLYGLFAVYAYVFLSQQVIPGWASIVLVTTFLGGCQLLFLGLIGEYIGTIFDEIKGRPVYIVARLAGPSSAASSSAAAR